MRLGARRKSSPPPKVPPNQQGSSLVRPVAIALLVIVTGLLVLYTLPQSTDYTQYVAKQTPGHHDDQSEVKGIVVSHGFLKISVQVAYKNNKDTKPAEPTKVGSSSAVMPPTPPGLNSGGSSPKSSSSDQRRSSLPPSVSTKPKTTIQEAEAEGPPNGEQKVINGSVNGAAAEEPRPPLEPPPPLPSIDPLLIRPTSKEEIVVDVIFHRMGAPTADSWLTCRLSDEDILAAIEEASAIWKRQAKVLLRFGARSTHWEKVSSDTHAAYQEHLARFPRNDVTGQPWTTENPGRIGLVGTDLIQILSPDDPKQWHKVNPIHVFCIGAFVGYNGVTWNQHVFIRSARYHKSDVEMDRETFTRILAHEIGHILNLAHPSMESCSLPCELSTCNLMCQQRWLPSGTDVRFARALTSLQVARARTAAGLLDIFSEDSLRSDQVRIRRFGLGTEVIPNTRPLKSPLVLLPQPLSTNETLTINRISLLPAKMKLSCSVALVTGHTVGDQLSLKARALGNFQNSLSVKTGASKLIFDEIDLGWWTNARHIEAVVDPPVVVPLGHFVGIAFSSSVVTFQYYKRQDSDMLHVTKVSSGLFSTSKAVSVEVKPELLQGMAPIIGFSASNV